MPDLTAALLGETRVQAAQAASDSWRANYFDVLAERDRLREALEKIASANHGYWTPDQIAKSALGTPDE